MNKKVRIFDKTLYAGRPPDHVHELLRKLASLGDVIVAVRGPNFSANLLGTLYVGEDGGDPVLRMKGCDCHIHVRWDKLYGYHLEREDVGYGPEPVVYLVDINKDPVINLFYPDKTYEEIEALLSGT